MVKGLGSAVTRKAVSLRGKAMSDENLREALKGLTKKWISEVESGQPCAETLTSCAIELEATLTSHSSEGEAGEPRNWKGVRWIDSIKARNLAEEIALHFAHDCNDSMCGEDADASNCEVAWIEDKLSDFLDAQAALTSHSSEVEAKGQRCSLCQGTGRMPRNIDIKQFLDAEHDEPSLLPQGPSGHTVGPQHVGGDRTEESK
jgi:hypothetical protein